jgi:hypothetical protein
MNEQSNLGASIIIYVASQHRKEVVDLLLRNGVVAPSNSTDIELAQIITQLLKSSKNFKKEFLQLLGKPNVLQGTVAMSGYSNAVGNFSDTFSVSPSPFSTTAFPTSTTIASTTGATAPKTGFTLDKALNIFTQGLNTYLTLDTNKTNRALANASVANAQAGNLIPQETINASVKSNTTMYVVLAIIGVVVVGGGIWYAVKNKQS